MRLPITTSWADGSVDLRVPAAWLENATFPVTVDPLLTRVTLNGAPSPESIDIARDGLGNDLMTVFTRAASASDHDWFAVLTTDPFGSVTTAFADLATWHTPHVRVATAGSPVKYCAVFERHLPDRRLRVHLHDGDDFTQQVNVLAVGTGAAGVHDWRPDVGGQVLSSSPLTPTGNRFMLVWQRETTGGAFANTASSGLFGRTLDTAGAFGSEFPIALGVLQIEDHEHPCVNQEARRTGILQPFRTDWLVVWQRYIGPQATWRVLGKLVSDSGTLDPAFWSATSSSTAQHHLTPHVAGSFGRYEVAFVETAFAQAPFKTTATAGHQLAAERVDWSPGTSPVNHPQRDLSGPGTAATLRVGGIAYDPETRSHWALTASSDITGTAYVVRTGFRGFETERRNLWLQIPLAGAGTAGGICFDPDANRFPVAFGVQTGTGAGLHGNHFTYVGATPVTASGTSCSTGTIAWNGSQQIGAEFGAVALTSAPASLPAIVGVSLATLDLNLISIGMPGCRLLIDTAAPSFLTTFATVTSANGAATVSLPLPESLPFATLWFQWFHFDLGANPLDLVSTQRLRVEIVK
jgi:hypothetical protein